MTSSKIQTLIFFSTISFALNAQLLSKYSLYQEKTKEILSKYDSTSTFDRIALVTPFVDYRIYHNNRVMENLHDSGFACKLLNIDSVYFSYPKDISVRNP